MFLNLVKIKYRSTEKSRIDVNFSKLGRGGFLFSFAMFLPAESGKESGIYASSL